MIGVIIRCHLKTNEKCTKLPAPTVVMNVKYHSNQMKTDQFTAKTVSKNIENHEVSEISLSIFI